ncbi:hypothetical protein F5Y03DRAFT_411002 [Xylaria venustula]|nr:hypothetical protein F5Y03DRAFT_411002 [Xylaria venustula]
MTMASGAIKTIDRRQWATYSRHMVSILWGFTEHDFVTFAIPSTIFGLLGATNSHFVEGGVTPPLATILSNIPLVLTFNWCNLLVFDMANQRPAISVLLLIGYGLFNYGSFRLVLGDEAEINSTGLSWITLISAVVMTTIQIQDLKDTAGDRVRGRKTVVLTLGEGVSRASIALFDCLWSYVCAWPWYLPKTASAALAGLSGLLATRVLSKRRVEDDRRTWRLCCLSHCCLYLLPVVRFSEP